MKKRKIILLALLILIVLVIGILYFMDIPCGGMKENGELWDGTCKLGPSLFFGFKLF